MVDERERGDELTLNVVTTAWPVQSKNHTRQQLNPFECNEIHVDLFFTWSGEKKQVHRDSICSR